MKNLIYFILLLMLTSVTQSQTCSRIDFEVGTSIEIGTGADVCANEIYINGTYSGGGTICDGPNPVFLVTFTAAVEKNNVKLSWTTENEQNNSGFDLERKLNKEGTSWQKLCFIQGNGTTTEARTYVYEDKKLQTGKYSYRLKQIDFNGNFEYFNNNNEIVVGAPRDFRVSQNYPNPSNPKSKIDYELPVNGKVTIKLYNLIGQEVITLVDEIKEAGYYTAEFDGSNLASGIYFYKILAGNFVQTKKMVMVK